MAPDNISDSPLDNPTGEARSGALSDAADLSRLVDAALVDLESRKRLLQQEIEQLERRRDRIQAELGSTFTGASQELAVRMQGFRDYLVGSLQDMAAMAEQLEAPRARTAVAPPSPETSPAPAGAPDLSVTAFAGQRFEEQRDRVRSLIDQYRTRPDYYGPPWQLRRTFESVHADRVLNWFFVQGGRGAVKSLGSRLQNVLVASAAVSALYAIYGNRLCTLVLASTPERLGEWRRWLQDCLGVARDDFGMGRGITLFESSDAMAQRAERLLDAGRLPIIIMDGAEAQVSLAALQFPLWLAFIPEASELQNDYLY